MNTINASRATAAAQARTHAVPARVLGNVAELYMSAGATDSGALPAPAEVDSRTTRGIPDISALSRSSCRGRAPQLRGTSMPDSPHHTPFQPVVPRRRRAHFWWVRRRQTARYTVSEPSTMCSFASAPSAGERRLTVVVASAGSALGTGRAELMRAVE